MITVVTTDINSKGLLCICRGCKVRNNLRVKDGEHSVTNRFISVGVKQQQPYDVDQIPLAYGQPRFRPNYNTPEGFRAGEEMKDKMEDEWKELRRIDLMSKGMDSSNKAYTEGGLVFLPRKGKRASANKRHKHVII